MRNIENTYFQVYELRGMQKFDSIIILWVMENWFCHFLLKFFFGNIGKSSKMKGEPASESIPYRPSHVWFWYVDWTILLKVLSVTGRVAHSLKSLKCRLHMYAATLADLCMTDDWYPSLIARSGPGLRLRAARSETTAPRPHCNVSRSCYCVHWHTHNQTLPYEYYFLRTV